MNSPAINVTGLRVDRGGRTVLDDLTFTIPRGAVTGLLGPSGCGKTTLIRAIVGVQRVHSGTVEVLGEPAGTPPLRSRVGYVTQAPSVYADLTVAANLRYFAAVLGVPENDRVLEAVALARPPRRRRRPPLRRPARSRLARLCTAGRAGTARARRADGRARPAAAARPLAALPRPRRRRHTLLVSSHVMDEADRCDRLLLMREGAIVADGTPAELRERTGADDLEEAFVRVVEAVPA